MRPPEDQETVDDLVVVGVERVVLETLDSQQATDRRTAPDSAKPGLLIVRRRAGPTSQD